MKKNTMDFTTGSVVKKLLVFVLPIILSTMLQDLYNTADKIVVGRFAENGSLALGAVGSVATATNLLVYLFSGLSLGINVICSNLRGAKKERELESAMHTAIMLSVIAGTAVSLLGIVTAKPMLRFIKTPDSLFDLSHTYMWIYFLGSPFSMLYNSGAGILLSNGDTKRPTVILICSGLVNLLLNLVLVVGCGLGVEGVALGTVASQLVSATWVLCILFDKKGEYRMSARKLHISKKDALSLVKIAIPTAINNTVFGFSNILMQAAVNTLGDMVIAGCTAATGIINLVYMIPAGFYSGCVSFTGQCYGARKFKRIDKVLLTAISLSAAGVLSCAALVSFFPEQILGLFNSNPDVIQGGLPKLRIMTWGYSIYCIQCCVAGCLHGLKKNTITTSINLFFVLGTRLPWALWLFPLYPNATFLFACYPISWILCGTAQLTFFLISRKKIWNAPQPEAIQQI